MILNLLFLIPLFTTGIICSYTDIKYGKIKNKWLIVGFAWVIVLYLSLAVYNVFFLHQAENINYLFKMIVNGFVALLVGYILWSFNLFAAGDAKLFALYAFLIPQEFYAKAYFSIFPSFNILINTFIPLVAFLTFKALVFSLKRGAAGIKKLDLTKVLSKENLKKLLVQLPGFLRTYILFVLVMVIIQLIRSKATESLGDFTQNPVFLFLLLFVGYRFLFRFIAKSKLIALIVVVLGSGTICYLIFSDQIPFLINILKLALIFMVLVGLSFRLLNFYIEQKETRKLKVEDLQVGMFPCRNEINGELQKKLGQIEKTGLTNDQLNIIKEFFKGKLTNEIKVYKTFALAPFIFFGAVITVLTKDSLIGIAGRLFFQF